MDESEEVVSYASVESNGKNLPEKEFKPKNTTNYFPTIFNTKERKRYIFDEGAVPLHEINTFIYDFIEQYINEASGDETYYLSSITLTTDGQNYFHLLKLPGNNSKLIRIETLVEQLDSFYNNIDENAFKIFLTKKNKFYRLDTDFKALKLSYTQFQKEKNRIKDLIDINTIKVSKA